MDSGKLIVDTDSPTAVQIYLKDTRTFKCQSLVLDCQRESFEYGKLLRVAKIALLNAKNNKTSILRIGEPFGILIECICNENLSNISFVVGIDTTQGDKITTVVSGAGRNL